MKLPVQLAALISALRIISPALSRTNPVRMASCAWIGSEGHVTMRAASFDWDVQYTVTADVTTPGEVWMPADVMRALPWGAKREPNGAIDILTRASANRYRRMRA